MTHDAFRQYEERQRQRQEFEKLQRGLQRSIAQQQALALEIAREQERRVAQQRQRAQRLQAEQQKAGEKQLNEARRAAILAQSTDALRIADQQRREALQAARLKRQEAQQIKQAGSPIEIAFKEAWCKAYPSIELTPQYMIGKYRVDFAHIPTKTVIELDGHPTHHTRKDRTRDYQRQRWIEGEGWHFVRFTGTEVFNDVESCIQIVAQRIRKVETHDHS